MSTREFWNDEPELLWTYRKVYMDKIKTQNEMENYKAWLNGLYIYDALNKNLYNYFGKKSNQPAVHYNEQPYNLGSKKKTKEEIEREERMIVEEHIRERNKKIKEMLKSKKQVK